MAKNKNLVIRDDDTIEIENANLPGGSWRNFSGGPTKYDPANTKRHFEIYLTDEEAELCEKAGYNVKWLEPRNPSEPRQAHLKVYIKYDTYPRYKPRIWKTRQNKRPVLLNENLVDQLDNDEITRVMLMIRPYDWEFAGRSGRKAMVKQMYVTIEENTFGKEFWPEEDDDEENLPFE